MVPTNLSGQWPWWWHLVTKFEAHFLGPVSGRCGVVRSPSVCSEEKHQYVWCMGYKPVLLLHIDHSMSP